MGDTARMRALVVGISEYPTDPLQFCAADGQAISEVLTMPEYGASVTMLLDGEATRLRLLEQLQQLFTSDADHLLFYFAGHGVMATYGGYLVTVDASSVEPGVDLPLVGRLIRAGARAGRTTTVLLDCCHAGAMTFQTEHGSLPLLGASALGESLPALPEGNVLFAACRPDELAYEYPDLGHGIFTHHLLEGLLGAAANEDGAITASSLHEQVARSLAGNVGQTLVYRGDIAGYLVLGTGFPPIQRRPLDDENFGELVKEGQEHLNAFQAEVGRTQSARQVWAESGYKAACQLLRPIQQWFSKREDEYPELKYKDAFTALSREVRAWQARLSDLENVTETPWGRVESLLGYGTFGNVWLINHADRGRMAFKVYHGHDIRLRDKLHRFQRGYEAMKILDHPHVIKVSEFTECPIGFFMDYIDGPNLRGFTGSLEVPDQLRLLLTIAETLAHAHSRSVVHRDVKPENILVREADGSWLPFLTDFDLAWFSTASVLTREALGSPFYSAPEQVYKPRSAAARDPKVDQYGFGQLCFFALTGSDPVPNASDNVAALRAHFRKWPSGDAARDVLSLYQRATASSPSDRHESMRSMCDALHTIIIASETSADEPVSVERLTREIVFGLVGMPGEQHFVDSFESLARRTRIAIENRREELQSVSLQFRLERLGELALEGLDNETARKRLNMRVDDVLDDFRYATRRSGRSGSYELFLDMPGLPKTMRGAELARRVLSRVVEAIERP
jgi:serine/threonine protein kinase